MKVMYLAPRYHTNQASIMKGWLDHGDMVYFLSQYAGKSEDYTCINPEIIGYSKIFKLLDFLCINIIKRNDPYGIDWKLKWGFSSINKLKKYLKSIKPDVVIMRERSISSICMNFLCVRYGIPAILYNQSPVFDKPKPLDWKHKLVFKLVPEYRITPVLLTGVDATGLLEDKKAYWLPFVMEPQLAPSHKEYFLNGKINILCVGKFERRKNHLMLIKVIRKLQKDFFLHLRIIGECSNSFHEEYLWEVRQYVEEHQLSECVSIDVNLKRQDVFEEYKKADVFVLPSTGEPAALSHLEAMAFSVPSICSDGNGTANYIIEGQTGFVFRDKDSDDLESKLRKLLADKKIILEMGKEAYKHVQNDFQFERYYRGIEKVMEKIRQR